MATPDIPLPRRRLVLGVMQLALPVALVLVVLALLGRLGWFEAALAWIVMALGLALVARRYLQEIWSVLRYAEQRSAGLTVAPPEPELSPLAADLARAVERLSGEFQRDRSRLSNEAAAAKAVFDNLPDPLILLRRDRQVLQANRAARQLLGEALVGRDLAHSLRHPAALDAVGEVLSGRGLDRQVELFLPVPVARDFHARVVAPQRARDAQPAGPHDPAALLALQDLTALKRAEQMRADFVANASHELRTPLATLIGFIETLQGPARDDEAARLRFLGIMHEQASRMARLVQDLLSLSRIEMNEHTPPSGRVDLAGLIRSVADMLRLQAEAKQMRIEIQAQHDLPEVVGDGDQLTQVFQNLLDNAVKYGRAGTPVRVELALHSLGERPPVVAVRVRDQGEGIPRVHLPRLTERFYRVDSARSRQLGGTGLGLAIVKHIVNRHRGSLTIDSVTGEGSCFSVYLPAAPGKSALHQTVT